MNIYKYIHIYGDIFIIKKRKWFLKRNILVIKRIIREINGDNYIEYQDFINLNIYMLKPSGDFNLDIKNIFINEFKDILRFKNYNNKKNKFTYKDYDRQYIYLKNIDNLSEFIRRFENFMLKIEIYNKLS